MMKIALIAAAIITLGACSGSAGDQSGDDIYTFDLTTYSPEQSPSALKISNATLVIPLGVGAREQTLSASAPGELTFPYTRVGCWIDPGEWFGGVGAGLVQVPAAAPVRLVEVTIDQLGVVGVVSSLQQLADATCVTFRSPNNTWHAFSRPSNVAVTGDSVRTTFTLDAANATTVAIFLPTHTYVSRVTYRVALE